MPFKNRLLTVLKVFRSNRTVALIIKGGPGTAGFGDAVIQLFTGKANETKPGEIVASNLPGSGLYELDMFSPAGSDSTPPNARYSIGLIGSPNGARAQMVGDLTAFLPQNGAVHVVKPGRLDPFDSVNGMAIGGKITFDQNPPSLFTVSTDISGLLTGGATQRPGAFASTVEKIGNGHAHISIHAQNASGATIANGTTIIAGGTMPAWASTRAGETINIPIVGELIGAVAGSSPLISIDSSGIVKVFGLAIPTGRFFSITGVYRSANYW